MVHLAILATVFLFCLATIYGAICDIQSFTIPNRVSYGLVALFAVHAILVWLNTPTFPQIGFRLPPVAYNIVLGLVTFIFFVVFWKLRWVGGGDVKFVSAVALWMGREHILLFAILLAVISIALVAVLKFLRLWNPYFQSGHWPEAFKRLLVKAEDTAIPYGFPAAAAAMILVPSILTKVS